MHIFNKSRLFFFDFLIVFIKKQVFLNNSCYDYVKNHFYLIYVQGGFFLL